MAPARSPRERGMTLIELLVAAGISAFVLAAVTGVFLAQSNQYQSMASRRDSQSAARRASTLLEQHLRLAGYGVDPNLTFEAYDSYNPATNTVVTGDTSFPDAIALHHRDPSFRRTVAQNGASAGALTLTEPLTEPMYPGQILLVLCAGATNYAYVTVSALAEAGDTELSLLGGTGDPSPIGLPSTRFRNSPTSTTLGALNTGIDGACYDTGEAIAVKVNRYAFFVQAFDDDGDAATADVPYLMLHRGLDINGADGVTVDDAVPLAPGVEQLQVAYVMNTEAGDPPVLRGVSDQVPGIVTWDTTATRPKWDDTYDHANRLTNNPANIRQVRFSLVVRGPTRSEALPGDDVVVDVANPVVGTLADGTEVWRQLENLGGTPATVYDPRGRHYLRTVTRLSVTPKNMLMRSQFVAPNFGG